MNKIYQKYLASVKYLESIQNVKQDDYFVKKTGRSIFLKRTEHLLKFIGNPQHGPKFIHVAGTSGKGSVANMIQSILTEAGFKTGLFTSPYPTTSIEKIKIDSKFISLQEFVALIEELKPAIDKTYQQSSYGRPSYFEIFTAIGFLYFKRQHCDYVVLEVGLGGRHDATNVIKPPAVTVINKIDFDHTEILGHTLAEIAKEKAAIIKPRTTFFTTFKNNQKVLKLLQDTCVRQQAHFNLVGNPKRHYPLTLLGDHQQANAELAAAVARYFGIKETIIDRGLKKVKLSCRAEVIQTKPLVILDGAHNSSKIKTTLKLIKNLTYKKLYLIIALTSDRNPAEVFGEIIKVADQIIVTRHLSLARRCYPPKLLANKLKTTKPIRLFLDPQQALDYALSQTKKNDLVLVTGSFYLAGILRQHWRREEQILTERKI